MIQIECPNCGLRNSQEFHFGGEYNPRPAQPTAVDQEEWTDYLYMRTNKQGTQKEWWFHRAGCQLWFLAERHMKSNVIVQTFSWQKGDQQA